MTVLCMRARRGLNVLNRMAEDIYSDPRHYLRSRQRAGEALDAINAAQNLARIGECALAMQRKRRAQALIRAAKIFNARPDEYDNHPVPFVFRHPGRLRRG